MDSFREKLEAFARRSESAAGITNLLQQARLPETCVSAADLDSDPWLLNCPNGTVDLRTETLLPHDRRHLITKICRVNYVPDASCPTFERFRGEIMNNNAGLIDWLWRFHGYCLTGVVHEKAVACFFGSGDNGKTTLLEAIRHPMGDYAGQVLIDTLMTRSESNATLADLADLRGLRFVTTAESEEGSKLSEGKLKYLTGMGEVKAARKYENFVSFLPTWKIVLDGNHRPRVRGTDSAIWNRLKAIPFAVSIPKDRQDKDLLDKLKAEGEGILAWLVRGCIEWQRRGLGDPPEVLGEVQRWREENDPLRDFLADECVLAAGATVQAGLLWGKYTRWAQDAGEKQPLARTKFADRLRALGCTDARTRDARLWRGIGLRDHGD